MDDNKGIELYEYILNNLRKDVRERGECNKCVISLTESEALELFKFLLPELGFRKVNKVTTSVGKVNIYYGK